MQAVILAAGMGKRLGELTKDNTKCMVKVQNKELIFHLLDILDEVGINKIFIVIGYKGEKLKELVKAQYKSLEIKYIENPVFESTNNIYSLFLAKEILASDDTMLFESDLIFTKSIIQKLINSTEPNLACVARYESWMDGTVVKLTEDNSISNFISKTEFSYREIGEYYKTVNIYKFSKEFSERSYIPFMEAYLKSLGKNEYYEEVLKIISFLNKSNIKGLVLDQRDQWYEIDDKQDLDIAETLFSQSLANYQKRYGGYWRFPKLIDFCYLVNPYFPPPQMIEEIKAFAHRLITEYPSGLNVINMLAAKMFNCKTEYVMVGNGAAELIKSLSEIIEGSIGVIFPTFNEYPESFGYERVVKLQLLNNNFNYSVGDILDQAKHCDNILLISPDNPSGFALDKKDLLYLISNVDAQGKRLIIDESFVDFSEEGEANTLISDSVLEKNKNLVVIKSISKSYGVPGLRLGVLASSDSSLIKSLRGRMPIWNINSFGEFFLQIIDKYRKDYVIACSKLKVERSRFFSELNSISFVKPYKSNSNFFLCEIKKGLKASQLCEILLKKFNIYIKDLTGKIGTEKSEYVRIAIRNEKDNNILIECLKVIDANINVLNFENTVY